jgi:FkbM family methyltransferase
MSWMTSSAACRVRTGLRRVGLGRLTVFVLRCLGYEKLFTRSMRKAIEPGHCVWDVGASFGVYSRMFCEMCGPGGAVYAFEPLPDTVARLRTNTSGLDRVRIMPVALSDTSGLAVIGRGGDVDAAAEARRRNGIGVMLRRGDELVDTGRVALPDVVKIDVAGHELEVLRGMRSILREPTLRHVFIKMHFAILHADDRAEVPEKIEMLLRAVGFDLAWIDHAHLHAYRA